MNRDGRQPLLAHLQNTPLPLLAPALNCRAQQTARQPNLDSSGWREWKPLGHPLFPYANRPLPEIDKTTMARSVVDPRQRKSANVKWMFSLVVFALRGKRTFISSVGSFDHCARPFCARCPAEKLENARTCELARRRTPMPLRIW
jgi:hypothetical protein